MHGVNFGQMPPEGAAAAHLNPPDLVHALRGLLQRRVARGLLGVLKGRERGVREGSRNARLDSDPQCIA